MAETVVPNSEPSSGSNPKSEIQNPKCPCGFVREPDPRADGEDGLLNHRGPSLSRLTGCSTFWWLALDSERQDCGAFFTSPGSGGSNPAMEGLEAPKVHPLTGRLRPSPGLAVRPWPSRPA